MKPLANRTHFLKQSEIRAISREVNAVGGINLGQGICDMPTPDPIKAAAKKAIDDNKSIYSNYAGIAELCHSILDKARTYNRIPVSSVDQIVVSVGSTGVFSVAILSLLDPGDEVILFEPFYGYHRHLLQVIGAGVAYVPLRAPTWAVDWSAFRNAITKNTKAVVVTTPGNPNGKVWTRDELDQLLKLAVEHDFYVITDEIYEYMLYDGRTHVSLASMEGAFERTITISGFSKTYNMTGWRLGYGIAPTSIAESMGLLNDLFYICAPTPLQHGVAAAFDMSDSYFQDLSDSYAAKRELMCRTLEALGFSVPWPEGSYYVLASFAPLSSIKGFEDDEAACETLIRRAGVGTVRGASFFNRPEDGRHFLRFCYAKEMPVLEEACFRLERAFGA